MRNSRFPRAAPQIAGAALLLAIAGGAHAAASGGGGGMSMPSISAPSFDPAAEYRKGLDALGAGKYAAARKAFDKVLKAAPGDANTNYLAGRASIGMGDWKRAKKNLERAVKAKGDMVGAREQLGIAYAKLGERPAAESQLAELKKLEAGCGACAAAGELKTAVASVSAALTGAPTARLEASPGLLFESAAGDGAYVQAVALINEKRYGDAIAELEKARTAFGAHPDILTYLGFAHRKLKRFDVAEDYYRQALAVAPRHKGATEYYGELMVERGDIAGAKRMLARLDDVCAFGCAEADELRRWIDAGRSPSA